MTSYAELQRNASETAEREQAYQKEMSMVPLRARIENIGGNFTQTHVFFQWYPDNPHQIRPFRSMADFFLLEKDIDADELAHGVTGWLIPIGQTKDRKVYTNGVHHRREKYQFMFFEDRTAMCWAGGAHIRREKKYFDGKQELSCDEILKYIEERKIQLSQKNPEE